MRTLFMLWRKIREMIELKPCCWIFLKIKKWNEELFGKMENLMMLMKKKGCLFGRPKHLPNSLRVLEWWGYPAASSPSSFHPKNLVILNLSKSYFRWDKPLEKSKVLSQLIFTGCEYIRQIPDMSGFPNLRELCVDDCTNLIEIHDYVGFLDKLLRFSAKGCLIHLKGLFTLRDEFQVIGLLDKK